jgi:hypothetical protein
MIAKEQFVRLATNITALGMIVLTAVGCGPATPPSDTSIIARFNAHRTELASYWKCSIMTESTVASAVLIP